MCPVWRRWRMPDRLEYACGDSAELDVCGYVFSCDCETAAAIGLRAGWRDASPASFGYLGLPATGPRAGLLSDPERNPMNCLGLPAVVGGVDWMHRRWVF